MTMIKDNVTPVNKSMEAMTHHMEDIIHVLSDRSIRQIQREDEQSGLATGREIDGGGHLYGC